MIVKPILWEHCVLVVLVSRSEFLLHKEINEIHLNYNFILFATIEQMNFERHISHKLSWNLKDETHKCERNINEPRHVLFKFTE